MTQQDPESSNSKEIASEDIDVPFTHGFFDRDKGTVAARKAWLGISLMAVAILVFVILGILSIYWAALGRSSNDIHNLSGWVVDFDGGEIGSVVTQSLSSIHNPQEMSWLVKNASEFPNGPSDVQAALLDHRCWAAVTVNSGATANLLSAVNSTNASYNTSQAISAYTSSGRNEASYRNFIMPTLTRVLTNITQSFGIAFVRQLGSQPINVSSLMTTAPLLVSLPINYVVYDLRPFDIPVASAVDFVGLIYLTILAFMLTNYLAAANLQSGFARRLRLTPLIVTRLLWAFILYFFVSLVYVLLSLAFGVPFGRYYGDAGGFVIVWMMAWLAMGALGLALESMITILTVKFVPIFLVLWIIVNVSVSLYPIEMLPAIFRYGFAMPFYNVSSTVRTVLFGTKNMMGLNFGVQLAWIAVSCTTLPFFQWIVRRKEVKDWERSQIRQEKREGSSDRSTPI